MNLRRTHVENIAGVGPLGPPRSFIRAERKTFDVCVITQNDRYTVGGEDMFDTLTDLVEFYKRSGIEEISGNWVYFKQVSVRAPVVELHGPFERPQPGPTVLICVLSHTTPPE